MQLRLRGPLLLLGARLRLFLEGRLPVGGGRLFVITVQHVGHVPALGDLLLSRDFLSVKEGVGIEEVVSLGEAVRLHEAGLP